MQIQDSLAHSQRFGAIYWELRRSQVPMQGNDCLVLKWGFFCPNLQGISQASFRKLKLIIHNSNYSKSYSFFWTLILTFSVSFPPKDIPYIFPISRIHHARTLESTLILATSQRWFFMLYLKFCSMIIHCTFQLKAQEYSGKLSKSRKKDFMLRKETYTKINLWEFSTINCPFYT